MLIANWNSVQILTPYQEAKFESGVYTAGAVEAYTIAEGDSYVYHEADTGTKFTINSLGNGVKRGENITVANNVVSIASGAGSSNYDDISLVAATGYSLAFANDLLVSNISFAQSSTGVTLAGSATGYKEFSGTFTWQAQPVGETFTITGLKDGAVLTANMFPRGDNG